MSVAGGGVMERFRELLPGLGITLSVVFISFLAFSLHEGFDPLVVSLIFGILVVNILGDHGPLAEGVDACMKYLLPLGIALYGTQVDFQAGSAGGLLRASLVAACAFVVAYFVARGFGLGRTSSVLLGTGLSTCGVAGIAVTAPLLAARREETAVTIISVMAVGLTGMLLYKFVPGLFGLEEVQYAFLTGTTLPMLGQTRVVALNGPGGAGALNFMYFRMGALAIVAVTALVSARAKGRQAGVPWFMAGFVGLAVLMNLGGVGAWLSSFRGGMELVARAVLSGGLAAVGLSLEFETITSRGSLPLFAGYLSWGITVLAVYLLLSIWG
jgi:uncharacterized integral membrane protein (TIGR00698 family)